MEGARFHVAVVGGGPAGLQAALVFARANIPLVLIDDGNARNKYSHGMHNLVSRDGMSPAEFKRISRDQLKEKCGDHVTFIDDHVVDIQGEKGDFNLVLANAASVRAHRVLLTNGVAHDTLPDVSGVKQLWGEAVFVCPFCDAYERGRDTHFAVLAHSHTLANVPILLKLWCKRITVFSHNTRDVVTTELREKFKGLGVDVIDGEVTNVTGDRAGVTVHTANAKVDANSLWVMSHFTPTELVRKLQLKTTETMGFATVARNETFETSRPGIFAAGDTSIGFMTQTAIAIGDAHKVAIFMVRNELWMI